MHHRNLFRFDIEFCNYNFEIESMVSSSSFSKTTKIFNIQTFNSSSTLGKDSFSFLAGITNVRLSTKTLNIYYFMLIIVKLIYLKIKVF